MFVYVIVCSETLKIYVGQHSGNSLRKYMQTKFSDAKYGKNNHSHLFAAMRKYPKDSWSIHPLMSGIIRDDLDYWERHFIRVLKTQHPDVGYNICDGGEGFRGPHSEAARRKMSRSHTGLPKSPEHIQHVADAQRGKPKATGFGEKIRKALTGRRWTPEQHEKIPAGIKKSIAEGRMKIHQWTPEDWVKQKIAVSAAAKKRHLENFIKTVAWG